MKNLLLIGGIGVLIVLGILSVNALSSAKTELANLRVQQKEMSLLKEEFALLKNRVDSLKDRRSLTKVGGIVQAVDEVFATSGLKDKIKSVKPVGRREIKDALEEEAEVQIEKVNMNEMINIFYKIENAPMILSIKKAAIKTSFENPELLNITMTLSLVKIQDSK
ncbi:MAG: hypothetical protein HZA07_00720 [Nitrospirae bacterium]|nr:hypothetical protein [Nitrospirota bacterium]